MENTEHNQIVATLGALQLDDSVVRCGRNRYSIWAICTSERTAKWIEDAAWQLPWVDRVIRNKTIVNMVIDEDDGPVVPRRITRDPGNAWKYHNCRR